MDRQVYVPEPAVIRSGILTRLVSEGKVDGKVVIHQAIVDRFERRANFGDFTGLDGIRALKEAAKRRGVEVVFAGLPKAEERMGAAVRELASRLDGCLVTCDYVAARVAEAMGLGVLYERPGDRSHIEDLFGEGVMSVHLKEGMPPHVKRGSPGRWLFKSLWDKPMTKAQLEAIVEDIIDRARAEKDAFVESEGKGSVIVQLGSYRIVVTRPPLSDGLEVTAVRPIVKLRLEDYKLPNRLLARLAEQAEGVLVAGAPGMGKSTFAQALAEFYHEKGKVVKTIEAPRDLQLPIAVTQYSKNAAGPEEIHDVLLLSRPDYTIFDELRNTDDFELFVDLRLAGVGMVGVVHATSPIDAIQRFVSRIELGMIPSVIDTVVFIEEGRVAKVYSIETAIKIPHGLKQADLARPVVLVRDFLTGQPEYEMYVFGEKTFVVPVRRRDTEAAARVAIERVVRRFVPDVEVEVHSDGTASVYVPAEYVPTVVRRCRRKLEKIRERTGLGRILVQRASE